MRRSSISNAVMGTEERWSSPVLIAEQTRGARRRHGQLSGSAPDV